MADDLDDDVTLSPRQRRVIESDDFDGLEELEDLKITEHDADDARDDVDEESDAEPAG
jgi:hypothetical protein